MMGFSDFLGAVSVGQAYRRPTGGASSLRSFRGPTRWDYETLTSDEAYSSVPVVYACVNRISNQLALLPRKLRNGNGDEVFASWVERPNSLQGGSDTIKALAASLLLEGEAFVVPVRQPGTFRTQSYAVINPRYVTHYVRGGGVQWYVNGQEFAGEMLHFRYNSLPGRIRGVSPLNAVRPLINTSAVAQQYIYKLVEQGGAYQILLSFQDDVDEAFVEDAAAQVIAKHSGPGNAWLPLVLGGNPRVEVLNQSNADSSFLDLSRMTAKDIASFGFNMDSSMFDLPTDQPQTYRNEPGLWWRFWQMALKPLADEIERGMSLLAPRGVSYDLDQYEMLLGGPHDRAKMAKELSAVNQAMGVKVFPEDELRILTGMRPLEEYEPMSVSLPSAPPGGSLPAPAEDADGEDEDNEDDDGEEDGNE